MRRSMRRGLRLRRSGSGEFFLQFHNIWPSIRRGAMIARLLGASTRHRRGLPVAQVVATSTSSPDADEQVFVDHADEVAFPTTSL